MQAENTKSLKDIMQSLLSKKRAYVFEIDLKTDFCKRINKDKDKIVSQAMYFNYYQQLQRKDPKLKSVIVHPE
jgi:hypothetical protein